MKMYLWERLDEVSGNYHEEGGLVVIAKDKSAVKKLIEGNRNIKITDEEWKEVKIFDMSESNKPQVFTFPDAGCC